MVAEPNLWLVACSLISNFAYVRLAFLLLHFKVVWLRVAAKIWLEIADKANQIFCEPPSKSQITRRILGYHFSSWLTATLNLCPIYLKLFVHKL